MRILLKVNGVLSVVEGTYIDKRGSIEIPTEENIGVGIVYTNTLYFSDDRVSEEVRDEWYVLLPRDINYEVLLRQVFKTGILDLSMYENTTFCNPDTDDISNIKAAVSKMDSDYGKASMSEAMRNL